MDACECWFLDVGQGLSNIIYLGGSRAIVIDCGPTGSNATIEFLKKYVDTIESLIISHNHSDHDGNVAKLLSAYPCAIRNINLLVDGKLDLRKTYSVIMNK